MSDSSASRGLAGTWNTERDSVCVTSRTAVVRVESYLCVHVCVCGWVCGLVGVRVCVSVTVCVCG